ncbi:hypothetical protein MSAN_02240100 [Mycena sanguinolenta]|uniref:Uncharacterized protein n=1 Tax=Mycena sanguinolenta TaxID=230812 RepID=A0A8H6XBU4_9AGAR|nr:hypothetical protein MSAN_02240100 [Mycena sanguinolenta]
MKFTLTKVSAVLTLRVSALPVEKRVVDANLVPEFGATAGVNPTGTGDCDGNNARFLVSALPAETLSSPYPRTRDNRPGQNPDKLGFGSGMPV